MSCGPLVYGTNIPGPKGDTGAAGTNGVDGVSSYTTVANDSPSAQPAMPHPIRHLSCNHTLGITTVTTADTSLLGAGDAIFGAGLPFGVSSIVSVTDATTFEIAAPSTSTATSTWIFESFVTINIASSNAWASVGEPIYVQSWGIMFVVAKPSATSLRFSNPKDATTGFYLANANAGISLGAGFVVSPGGAQGPAGSVGSGALLIANNLNDVANVAASRSNLGLGTVATFAQANTNGSIPRVDDASGLTAGECVFATASGVESKTAALSRTALGLGTAAVKTQGNADTNLPAVDQAAGLTNGQALFATATGIQSITAAAARTALGITAGVLDFLLFRDERANGVASGAFPSGAAQIVPINTEVSDTGGHGSIAGNQITLAAGTYTYMYGVIGYKSGNMQGNLYNITDAAVISGSYGQAGFSPQDAGQPEFGNQMVTGQGQFVLATAKVIRLECKCSTSNLGSTFGNPLSFGVGEKYSFLALWFQ